MATRKRKVHLFNVKVTAREHAALRARARRETGGNIAALIRLLIPAAKRSIA